MRIWAVALTPEGEWANHVAEATRLLNAMTT